MKSTEWEARSADAGAGAGTLPGVAAAAGGPRRRVDLLLRLAREAEGGPERIPSRGSDGPAPLSFGQERLWLVHQLDPSSAAYNVGAAFRLPRVDVAALERALGQVVRRHEALRTVFREIEGTAMQVVLPAGAFTFPVVDLSTLAAGERDGAVRRIAAEEAARPYDLADGPLFRPCLLRLGDEDVLLLNLHHIVTDGVSTGVLQRELAAFYGAYATATTPQPAPLAIQYADYAAWQRNRLRGAELDRLLAWWTERLAGAPALLELPADRPRPAAQSFRGAAEGFALPAPAAEPLRALARAEGGTLFMVLLAAFDVLLARYTGRTDLLVGTPVEGRGRRELEGLIGFFVNTLVVRTDLAGAATFREVLRRVRADALGAFQHQELPFERLVAELQPQRSLSHSPLVQVVFTLETAAPASVSSRSVVQARAVELETRTAQFDLSLTLRESADGLGGTLVYAADLFDRATMQRMAAHLARVVAWAAANPDAPLSALELADGDERRLLLDEWNRTARPYPRDASLGELFAAQVRARPDAEALAWDGESLTYAELDARANRIAHHLTAQGVGPDARVGVLLERGPALVLSILSIVKAGGCYVSLDPAYPPERLRLMVEDSAISVVVTLGAHAGALADVAAAVVRLDADAAEIAARPASAPESGVSPDNLAYIVYTSGSTGRPKGVMVTHRNVAQLVVGTDYVRLGPGDRIAQASNASFDALTFEAWGAWLNGAALVGIPRDVLLSPPAFRDALRENGITTLYQTTALLNQLTREAPGIFEPLREVLFGGQAVDAESVRRLLGDRPPRRLLHMYGPTETTAWSSFEEVTSVAPGAATVSVGRPTANQRVYVLDPALRPAPAGVPGEAYVGGEGIVRGYLDRPALTAERFVPDPWSPSPGARMYRTGDRLRWVESAEVRECGSAADSERTPALTHSRTFHLEFVGRLDAQVKIRGFRIEPGEIESALATHPAVREARVIPRADAGETRLVAYVVGDAVDDDALRAHLRRTLPEYMLPAAFVALERLPLTPNGKLDVAALPAPEYARADRYVAPSSPAEEVMAAIWAEVLRLDRVGAEDDFFALGGHSLLATRVVSRVRDAFGVELPLRALFEGPTVAAMAARVEALRRDGAPALPPIAHADRAGVLPLSFAQERLWFLDRLQPGSAFYNSPIALRLSGELHVAALERALGEVVRRHDSLRTVFAQVDGAPVQVIAPFSGFALEVEDVAAEDVARRVAEEAVRPFDLAAGPLFRARLLRVSPDDHVLLIAMHHVITDGWSMGVLVRELAALYASSAAGVEVALPDLPVQYADFAAWQREHLRGAVLDAQLAYWRGRLAGAPELLELPTDYPRPAVQAFRGARIPISLQGQTVEALRALGRREGATLYMVVLGAFQLLLSRWSGSDDVVVGSPIAGRARREVEELIGFFVNTLVLRTDLSGDPSFGEVLRRVRETTLGAYEHQDLPFEKLVAELRPERSLSHSPLVQVMFTLNDAERRAIVPALPAGAMPGLRVGGVEAESGTTRYDLSLDLSASADGLTGFLEYSTDLFERETVERMLGQLRQLLDRVVADPALPLSRIDLLDEDERARVLSWGRGDLSEISDTSILFVHDAVAARAARTPDAAALAFAGGTLSYAELDRRANQLAHHLRRRGVGPDTRVGICLERSPALPIAMLGVLKAGGAYVPLDPAYPAERLAWMLEDAHAPLLLTTQAQRDRAGAHAGDTLVLETAWPEIAREAEDAPAVSIHPESLAYVIYTSGSTGRPKGVGVPHRAIAAHMAWMQRAHPLAPADRVLQKTPASFDASVWEFWAPLMAGATLAIAGPEAHRDAAQLGREVREGGITILQLVPSLLHALLEAGSLAGAATLRRLFCGGEALPAALAARARALLGDGVEIVNLYGPTEVCIDSVTHVFDDDADAAAATVPIGRPVDRVRAWVLGRAGELLPAGVPGELCLGGEQLARGYLDRPAATALAFVPDPFSGVPGARLYRTGDRARWRLPHSRTSALPHSLEYLGRLDDQVKVRGFRVEPGEVAQALRGHPSVRDAAVVARGAGGDARLIAYFVPAAGEGRVDDAALREHLRMRLPAHMVPAAFVAMDALPLTPSGKLDRRALPAPVSAAAASGRRLRPETALEARLAELWRELLEVDEVGVEDNFFDLGGHSLLLIRLQSRLASELGAEVSVVELFQYPTVRSLAGRLQGNAAADTAAADEGHDRGGARQAAMARRLAARRRGEG